jgi:hypothetical protein
MLCRITSGSATLDLVSTIAAAYGPSLATGVWGERAWRLASALQSQAISEEEKMA